MALTSKGYDGSITESDLPSWTRVGRAAYGVAGAGDWKVTTVAGQDRTVSVAAGIGFGRGVVDTTDAAETLQLAVVGSGSRWDTLVRRRDFASNTTTLVAVQGTSTLGMAAGRLTSTTGGTDDQPIALVQVTAGAQLPTGIVDMRCWAGSGGLVAASTQALAYLDEPGSVVWVDGIQWVRRVSTGGVAYWDDGDPLTVVDGALHGTYAGQQRKKRIRARSYTTDGNGDVIIMPAADFSGILTADMTPTSTFELTFTVRIVLGNLVARAFTAGTLRKNTTFAAVADITYW